MTASLDRLRANWNYPTRVRFGIGRIAELADACRAVGIGRPLLVTDAGLARLPLIADMIAANEAAGLPTGLFSDVQPNPIWANVAAGLAAYRDGGHDGVIAVGGGSSLDVGKAIAFMLPQTRPIWDFEDIDDWYLRATVEGIAPVIAVPTTAGTGSEVGRGVVITNEETHTKKILFHPKMLPEIALLDPALTVGMPRVMTVGTGMDALAHNLEAYCTPMYHPMAEGIGAEGCRLIKEWLPVAASDGTDLEARAHVLAAAAMGAAAFQKGLGAVHALSHPVGALYHTHHGMTNGVFLPYVLNFNRPAIEAKTTRLAAYLGLPNPSFDSLLAWVLELRESLGVPHTLGGLGVSDDSHVEKMAAMAEVDPPAASNPVPLTAAAAAQLFRQALSGTLS
jgi:alcohol dehydrogenase